MNYNNCSTGNFNVNLNNESLSQANTSYCTGANHTNQNSTSKLHNVNKRFPVYGDESTVVIESTNNLSQVDNDEEFNKIAQIYFSVNLIQRAFRVLKANRI